MQFTAVVTSLLATAALASAQNATGYASPTSTGGPISYSNSTTNSSSPAYPTAASNGAAALFGSSALGLVVAGAAAFVL
ncbi:hypothetical protein Tdes44962_MAKER03003 [Teratosphaeria destructans]|uniref:Uncharacterized protein n=1 Tax=Teratosphaeria destructans TaxID=418781 RepID=A0A9W7SRD9_9PEZI|nr:hypothetical protein Tdes44962_MAKER03003 [Teratosphaeria destructans]